MKIFSNFSFEPTFKFNSPLPKGISLTDEEINNFYCGIGTAYKEIIFRPGNKYRKTAYLDADSLEVPTGIYQPDEYEKFLKDYQNLILKPIRKHNFVESSVVCMDDEGGCHINFGINHLNKIKQQYFIYFLRDYLLNNPSITWTFLAPNDNISSSLIELCGDYSRWGKGDAITVRHDFNRTFVPTGHYDPKTGKFRRREINIFNHIRKPIIKYLELRFFMMPRNLAEFEIHFEFANKLMFFIMKKVNGLKFNKNLTQDLLEKYNNDFSTFSKPKIGEFGDYLCSEDGGKTFNPDYRVNCKEYKKELNKYTFRKADIEIKKVCEEIGFDHKKILSFGKDKILKERFKEYGKEHLN